MIKMRPLPFMFLFMLSIGLGAQERPEQISLTIYPNPATTYLDLSSSNVDLKVDDITMFDLLGIPISIKNATKVDRNNILHIDLLELHLLPGLYFITVTNKGTTLTKKFIVK